MESVEEKQLDDEESLNRLVDLQMIDGSFYLTSALAKLLGTDLDSLQAGSITFEIPTVAWGTALAMAYMKFKLKNLQTDWQLMYKKAKEALDKIIEGATTKYRKLISGAVMEQKALEVLKTL